MEPSATTVVSQSLPRQRQTPAIPMLPARVPSLAQLLELFPSKHVEVLRLGGVDPQVERTLHRDSLGHVRQVAFHLRYDFKGQVLAEDLVIGHAQATQLMLPLHIEWLTNGFPQLLDPSEALGKQLRVTASRVAKWATPRYLQEMSTPQEALQRMLDQVEGDVIRYFNDVTLSAEMPAARTLVYLEPYPSHLVRQEGCSPFEYEMRRRMAAAKRCVELFGDQIDVTACSQNRPLMTASLTGGESRTPLVLGTPFSQHIPPRRTSIGRSIRHHTAACPGQFRVRVKGFDQAYADGLVPLLTGVARVPFNSLDTVSMTPDAADKLTSRVARRVTITNPFDVPSPLDQLGDRPVCLPAGQLLARETFVDVEHRLELPEGAYPPRRPDQKGHAAVTAAWSTAQRHGVTVDVVEFTLRYDQPVLSGCKVMTPGTVKGVCLRHDFKCEAFINGQWQRVQVLIDGGENDLEDPGHKRKGFEKRGAASILAGVLELACEMEDIDSLELPADVTWQELDKHLPRRLLRRKLANPDLFSGQVPLRYVDHNNQTHETQGWVGRVGWLRTENSSDRAFQVGHASVPAHLLTYAASLRGYKRRHPEEECLIDWLVQRASRATVSRQVADVLSMPALSPDRLRGDIAHQPVIMVQDEDAVWYRNRCYQPVRLDQTLKVLGGHSFEILEDQSHLPEGPPEAGPYPQTVLDARLQSHGALIKLPIGIRLPGLQLRYRNQGCTPWLFLPPDLCKHYLAERWRDPITGRPIVTAVAQWFNALTDACQSKPVVRNRIATLIGRIFDSLVADLSTRDGLLTQEMQRRIGGLQYPVLALDDCPPGVLWMSRRAINQLARVSKDGNEPIPVGPGTLVCDVRFPVEPGTGIQAYRIEVMPAHYDADVIGHSRTVADLQDGDCDGDIKMLFVVPLRFAHEVRTMVDHRPHERGPAFQASRFLIHAFDHSAVAQLTEAMAQASVKTETPVISSLYYHWIVGIDWRQLELFPLRCRLRAWAAFLHEAVKKDRDEAVTWKLLKFLNTPKDGEQFDQLVATMTHALRHEDELLREDVLKGLAYLRDDFQRVSLKQIREELILSCTLNAPRLGDSRRTFLSHLQQMGTDNLFRQLLDELTYGGK